MVGPEPKLREYFSKAVQFQTAEEQAAYLEQACLADAPLRAKLEELLQAHREAGSFLQEPSTPRAATVAVPPVFEQPGAVIGPYKLLQQIGEGGMGIVFMAEQTHPVQRKVALKVIKPGMDSRQVIARFEAERQALAMMDHVNIARVLDAGTTGDYQVSQAFQPDGTSQAGKPDLHAGRPYFVMELVHGVPITKYCDDNHLTPRERLELFVPVCQAIQHAHQKGIIHRDIKPSNVMITLYDGKPVPKVIDFGVAKATEQKLTERTLFTQYGTLIGTLEYMSPEQAEMSALGVDTRSDIYSLGVLLYELLTGSTPLTHKRMKEAAYAEILRMIKEEEPPRPSTRLSDSGEALASISANRQTEPAKLTKLVRGELDWIAMKCLEKDRNRRYETANGFAADVQRYLADEPVLAGPPSTAYRLRKFVKRNKGPVLAACLVVLALLGGMLGTTVGLVRAETARKAAADRAEGERLAKESAVKRLAQIEKGIDILTAVFEHLDPRAEEKEGRPLRAILADQLIKAADQLEGEAVGDPVAVAGLQDRLGKSLLNLGMSEPAIRLFLKARRTHTSMLGSDHADTLTSMNNLALGYKIAGQMNQALQLHEETLALRKANLGLDHPDTLESMNNLAAAYRDDGKPKLALPLHEEALRRRKATLGLDHVDTLVSMNNLALSYQVDGKLDLAVALYEETLRLRKAKLGSDHRSTLTSMSNLALGYKAVGKLDQAMPLEEETLRLRKATLGHDHPETLVSMGNLAGSYRQAGKPDQALPLFEEDLKRTKAKLGDDHPETLTCMNNLALCLQAAGKLDQALPLYEETLTLRKAKLGHDHPRTLTSMSNLAFGLNAAGRLAEALPLCEETLKLRTAKLGADHPDTLISMSNLAKCYEAAGKLDQALPLFQEVAMGIEMRRFPQQYANPIFNNVIGCHEQLKQFDQAEAWRRKWLVVVKAKGGPESAEYANELAGLGANLLQQKRHTDAEPILRECLAILQKKLPEVWPTFDAWSLFGGALLGQEKYADAEPLLLKGYEGMKQRAETMPPQAKDQRLGEALERLVQLYDAWGNTDQADQWRSKLELHRQAEKKASK